MTAEAATSDVLIYNMAPEDGRLHSNVLVVYEDQQASPSCTAAFVGHMFRYAGRMAIPFASGKLIATVPFRVETSRLGKPVSEITYSDLANLKAKYELEQDAQFTMLLRKDILAPQEQLLDRDIEHYANMFQDHLAAEIENACFEAVAEARQIKVQPDSPVNLLYGVEEQPTPVESAVFSVENAGADQLLTRAYTLLWQLIRCKEYAAKLTAAKLGAVALRVHVHDDGTCCIGLQRQNPLMLVSEEAEIAHFHHVAPSEEEAHQVGLTAANLISGHFELEVNLEVTRTLQETINQRTESPGLSG